MAGMRLSNGIWGRAWGIWRALISSAGISRSEKSPAAVKNPGLADVHVVFSQVAALLSQDIEMKPARASFPPCSAA
jgi:hypothetical protein